MFVIFFQIPKTKKKVIIESIDNGNLGGINVNDITILVVEDDLEINRLVTEHLKREGYTIVSVFNGTDAFLKLSLASYQMVIFGHNDATS